MNSNHFIVKKQMNRIQRAHLVKEIMLLGNVLVKKKETVGKISIKNKVIILSRPMKPRNICGSPNAYYFKPRGIPLTELEEITLSLDEFEALRLKDVNGLQQQEAAEQMNVSRPTFQRILTNARKKVSEALVYSKALRIEEKIEE